MIMSPKLNPLRLATLAVFACSLLYCTCSFGQCYLSQGCKPVDNLTYQQNGNGQVYHGDGASNDGMGGWTNVSADFNQCLSCHYGTDTFPYLLSGHKNTLRKMAPGILWHGPDGANYPNTDSHYGSGSLYDWALGQVTVGWCDPVSVPLLNGYSSADPECQYPFYTLPNSHDAGAYVTVPPTVAGGGVRTMFYVFGGWMKYGGRSNPPETHLGTIFDSGFTGGLYPNGNFACARCHATGYNFDDSSPEPTQNTNTKVSFIPDTQFRRAPSDGFLADGTNGTSSWYLTGVQCERCHVAARGNGSHPYGTFKVTKPQNEAATALCMECHRQENITMADTTATPPITGNIAPATGLTANDHGYCSDKSTASYALCVGQYGKTWIYKPRVDHEAGPSFLNSPHARFTGVVQQNAQHSADLSVTLSGTYSSDFSLYPADHTKNSGCTGCHDPHQSTVAAVNAKKPIVQTCKGCHRLSQTIMTNINHPSGPGTPFATGTSDDIPGACIICHMQGALGSASNHLIRINPDVNYHTFPTPDQLYTENLGSLNTSPEFSPLDGTTFSTAAWLDVDLACGQCHVGNDGVTNAYGLKLPPGMPGAHAYTRAQLAYWAANMHAPDPSVPMPTFTPKPTTYTTPQSVTIADVMKGATIYYTTDGSIPTRNSAVYASPLTVASTTTINTFATYPGYPQSGVASATYSIVLPQAPMPSFKPLPSTYGTVQSVTLSDSVGLPIYYTLDGSTPTTNSTLYSTAILVTKNTTINAMAAGYGYQNSPIASGTYLIQAPAPIFSLSSGTYSTPQTVTLSDSVSGATIYYTNNGSTPTTSSPSCANPCQLTVSTTSTLKAMAAGGGYAASNISFATYTFAASTPTFSPAQGTYNTPQTVTIWDSTSGATIYYTTNGTIPTTSSLSCFSPCPVSIATTTTIRAMASGAGISQSSVAVATYTIAAYTPTFAPASGTYRFAQTVTISDASTGVTIYYTTNGSFPTTASPSCANPCSILVSTSETVRAMAAGNGYSQSGTAVATYTITGP
jgi:predicted CXXCH cytochrome family protein